MRFSTLLALAPLAAALLGGCRSASNESGVPVRRASSALTLMPTNPGIPSRVASVQDRCPSPNLPVYGKPGKDRICVYVLGEVKRPGCYYLAKGAVVRDAVESALGLTRRAWWGGESGIVRPSSHRMPELIHFMNNRANPGEEEEMKLEEGDQVVFGYEMY